MNKKILAIETSCDETAASLIDFNESDDLYSFEVLSNVVASQIDLHKKWGGVFPELASRAHLEAMIPVLEESLNDKIDEIKKVDAIAVTQGPGLIGSLMMGVETANVLASFYNKPLIPVQHIEGHIYAAFCQQEENKFEIKKQGIFPILALVVSGGHTSLILMRDHLKYEVVGHTIDDAAGEAFDKVARIMDLGYPGGPIIEKVALDGNNEAYDLPQGLRNSGDFNFSFSGVKTSVLYKTKNFKTGELISYDKADMAASFQKAVCDILIFKTKKAIEQFQPKTVILSGGVSANSYLRSRFTNEISQSGIIKESILIPPKKLSTDNAVGIAIAGALKNKYSSYLEANANLGLTNLEKTS